MKAPLPELRAYLIAILAVAVATVLRVWVAPGLFTPVTSMPFFVAMLIAAWYGGLGPGLVATLLGALACAWYVFLPLHSFTIVNHEDQVKLVVLVGLGVAVSVGSEALHEARRRTLAMSADIEERRRMEERLRKMAADLADESLRKDRFLATLSHELRNPLAPMRNALQVMKLANNDPLEVEGARRVMERQLAQMVRLVDDLLDVSRISRDKLELRRESVTLRNIIDTAVENTRPIIERQSHQLTVSLPSETVHLFVDPTRLAQVFSNLLNNAAKFTDANGEIRIVARIVGDSVSTTVFDNGVGVSPDMVPRVLEMFGQAENSRERSSGGLGIGLSLAKRLVEMHDGSMELRSGGLGQGTEVEVRLPLASGALASAEIAPTPQATTDPEPATLGKRRRILIADDNVDSAKTLALLLDILGHETRVAHDGIAALQAAEEFRPEIVLLDIGMPRLDGYQTCKQMRSREWGTSIAIVAVTGWGQKEDRDRTSAAGFDLHLVKPLDPVAINALLVDLVSLKMT